MTASLLWALWLTVRSGDDWGAAYRLETFKNQEDCELWAARLRPRIGKASAACLQVKTDTQVIHSEDE